MSLRCKIGYHQWAGCRCLKCGISRDKEHYWDGCKCDWCGKTKDQNHSWEKDDCTICSKCGFVNAKKHSWDGCKCKNCGKTKDENHSWKKDDCTICSKCGSVNTRNHSLDGCKCLKCNKISHTWIDGKCSICNFILYETSDNWKETGLHKALRRNDNINEIRNLCLNGLVNIGNVEGFTPLMQASGKNGDLEIVKLLVELGADINARSIRGTTALSMASLHENRDIAEFLKSHGSVVDFVIRKW